MGIALASNVGGMASPISSPQNVISMGIMSPSPSWGEWFLISLPICVLLDGILWGVLLLIYKPNESNSVAIKISAHNHGRFNFKQLFIIFITCLTILLWCVKSSINEIIGDMGAIAILPIVAFFGLGILTKDDWNSMLWSGIYDLTTIRNVGHGRDGSRQSNRIFGPFE